MKRVLLSVNNSWHEYTDIQLGVFNDEKTAEEFAQKVRDIVDSDKVVDEFYWLFGFECSVIVSGLLVSSSDIDPIEALHSAEHMMGLRRS